jgi:hypothetical protein
MSVSVVTGGLFADPSSSSAPSRPDVNSMRAPCFLERTRQFQRLRTTAGLKVRQVGFAKNAKCAHRLNDEIGVAAQLASHGKDFAH